MMYFCRFLLTVLLACSTQAIQIKTSYGPPPPQRFPHREYGVPQQMPFREYGPPALKYGPPNLNLIGGSGSGSGLHEQIKNHYGAPKPFYGPPYKFKQQYGPPAQQYGPPIKPGATYGPPPQQQFQHKPAPSFGPPKHQYGPPLPQALPSFKPPPQFKPSHQPATSYGPPPSGPLNIPAKQIYGPPPPNYGPPPLPHFNQGPETTIIVTEEQGSQNHQQAQHLHQHQHQQQHQQQQQQHQQQTHIQVDASGHTHSVSGSQAPFHTACHGWKPIPAPVGAYIENNHIDTQSGYSQVAQTQAHAHTAATSSFSNTQYSGGASAGTTAGIGSGSTIIVSGGSATGGSSIVDGLTDEQLVALALQSGSYDVENVLLQNDILPSNGPAGNFNHLGLNSIEAQALQLSLGSTDGSYNRPPTDSYAPGAKYAHKFNKYAGKFSSQNGFGISGSGGNFGHSQNAGNFGPPRAPNGKFGSPHLPNSNYGGPPPLSHTSYRPPLPPNHGHGSAAISDHQAQAGLGIQYGKQTGNLGPFPTHGGVQPSKPVAYRPPVPAGLFETIGATVQHVDKFGVKPPLQAPTYIPPAANEIAQTGTGNLNINFGAPQQQIPQNIIEQQLPQNNPPQVFIQQQQHNQQQQQHASHQQGQPHIPIPQAHQQQQQHLPPQQQQFNGETSFTSSASAAFDSSAFAATQYNNEFIQGQSLPTQHEQPRFHNCGNGPNLVGAGNFNYQQQQQQHQQQEQYSSGSSTSIAQSIPVSERHTHFVTGPANSYGPPPSGGNELDNIGYASEKSQVTALPDGTNSANIPGLDVRNVDSGSNTQVIHIGSTESKGDQTYQIQFSGIEQGTVNHEEILSADLLQTILNAVEQPQQQHQTLPTNHKAENRADIEIYENSLQGEQEDENEPGVVVQETKLNEVKAQTSDEHVIETPADVQEIKPEANTSTH